MSFDIHAIDELESLEDEFYEYQNQLLQLFINSPEGQAHAEKNPNPGFWAHALIEYGFSYIGEPIPEMTADGVAELLIEVFPRKISLAAPEQADDAFPEWIAFWNFLKREFKLKNADEILGYLNSENPDDFKTSMLDPANFGMAKSLFMMGQQSGYDMTTEEGLNAFTVAYQQNALMSRALEQLSSAEVGMSPVSVRSKKATQKAKRLRKIARASRKKNRKR